VFAPTPSLDQSAKFVLRYQANVGQTERRSAEMIISAVVTPGSKMTLDHAEIERITCTAISPSGDLTLEERTEKSQTAMNGVDMGSDDRPSDPDSVTFRPDGTRPASGDDAPDKDDPDFDSDRTYAATTPVFPAHPVGVGDRWSYNYAPHAVLGPWKAHLDFAIIHRELIGKVDTFEVSVSYVDSGPGTGVTARGTMWIEIANGDCVRTDVRFDRLSFGPPEAHLSGSATYTLLRTEGGMLAADGNAIDSPAVATPAAPSVAR
jgi:hypothetical protein